ncbi:MAG: GNAT family N-acetyltransferase [Actinomycetota bacterium]|nr:GNAT family N-acetyltransferase [Actinomycetota bacterium]
MSVSIRPPRDPAEVARLVNAASRAEYGSDSYSEDEIRRWFSLPRLDVQRDMFVAEEAGRPVAYADVGDAGENGEQFWIDLCLPPDATDAAGEKLVEAATRRAREIAAGRRPEGDSRIIAGAASTNERAGRLLASAGFRLYRQSYRMAIDLDGDLPEPRFPDGIEVRTLQPGEERAVFDAVEEAFRDSWDHVPGVFEQWRHWLMEYESFDADLWWIARDGDEIAGFCLCRPHEGEPGTGWVSSLGVRRPWRRRGLARALLLRSFHEFARRGFSRVALGVDAESLTGANRLYESAGMRPIRETHMYEKTLA